MVQSLMPLTEIGSRRTGSHRGGVPQQYTLDEPGRRLMQACYDGRSETITELCQRLSPSRTTSLPRWVVRKWGQQLGLARQCDPRWTPDELEYLQTKLHRMSIADIARHLGRTQTAVKLKAKRLGMSKTSEGYTMRSLCMGLGCDHHKVERWLKAGWLKGTRRQSARTDQQGGDIWLFTDAAIHTLIKEHPTEIDPRRADWVWLVDILTSK